LYDFLFYLSRERENDRRTRARKVSCLKSFFKYCANHLNILETNPASLLESPKMAATLPTFLSVEQSVRLLNATEGRHALRDYTILTLFLNCGIRLAELTNLNTSSIDLGEGTMRVRGKGNRERLVYLNEACTSALRDYLGQRPTDGVQPDAKDALFLSGQKKRISRSTVQKMVERCIEKAGLGGLDFSTHKLRHTAATLMFSQGVDTRTLQQVLGHRQLNTTQIYTHVVSEQMREATALNPLSSQKRKKR